MNKLIAKYLEWKQFNKGAAVATCDKYGRYLHQLADALHEKGKTLHKAEREDLEQFAGVEAFEREMSARTRRVLVACIRDFYKWLRKNKAITENPAEDLPYPKAGKRLPVAMGLSGLEAILWQPDLETFIGVRDLTIMMLLGGCGPRVSGVVGLNESDLLITHDKNIEQLTIRFKEKGSKERLVPVPHEARLMLRAYINHAELREVDRTLPDGNQVLFISTRNRKILPHDYYGEARRLSARTVFDRIRHYGEAAKLPKDQLHPHALRHLFGAELAEEDVDLDKRQVLLGHEDPKTSMIYSHLAHRKLRQVTDKANPLGKIRTPTSGLLKILENKK